MRVSFVYSFFRLTPACAGKTIIQNNSTLRVKAHPRLRGEDKVCLLMYGSA